MGALVRSFDWEGTPVGDPAVWPVKIRNVVELMLDSTQPMFVAWGRERTWLNNDAFLPIAGRKHPASLGAPSDKVWAEAWDSLGPLFERVFEGESIHMKAFEITLDRRGRMEDAQFDFSFTPIRDDDRVVIGLLGVSIETTERVADERRLLADTERERDRLFEMSRDLFGVATFDGMLKSINPAWSRYLDRTQEELLGRPFSDIIHPEDLAATGEVVETLRRGKPVHQFFVRLLKADGTPISFAWSAVPEGADAGTFYTVGRDITEEQRREEMLRQSQKMEAVGQLTGGIAHDFNNLLAGISGSIELVRMRMNQGRASDVERYLAAADGAAKRAAALTHRLLAFSRRQTLAPKPTDLKKLVVGMEDLIARTVGPAVELETVYAAGLWPSLIDPSQLENAVLNLCINARDAMPDGGRITIETANRWMDARTAKERGIEPGQYVSLCVSDTGTGMAADVVEKAFDPFFTTKPIGLGTGLGLSMIYGFAHQSGGAVRIYSELGQGAMICIYLPRHVGAVDEPLVLPGEGDTPRAEDGETVLVVDDEPTVRMLVTEVLADLGYTAIEAADGPAALKILNSDARIDLLVTDVGLPGGMNGRQVADAGRAVRAGLKVLFITGYAENAVLSHGHLDPGMHVLTKPFSIDAMATRIRDLITT